jgi:Zn-finger protein
MANSWRNPVFQAFYSDAKAALGKKAQDECLACHAPLAHVTGDRSVQDPTNQEGVSCNFCHNISSVDVSPKPASYVWDASNPDLMRGPYDDPDPGSAHESVRSELYSKGDFCASCHWYERGPGLVIEATHPQWKGSKAAATGKQCQDCHMPPSPGRTSIISRKMRDKVWAHRFQGAYTPALLDSVATLRAAVEKGRLKLTVRSLRAGHSLPGGGGSFRAITLEVVYKASSGGEISRVLVQTCGTVFADSAGRSPVPKWLARSVASQSEIPTDEPKVEWANIPAGARKAEAVLTYHFLLPAFMKNLESRGVDLSGHKPRVIARAEVPIP